MDIDGITAIGQMSQVVLAGGPVEKTGDASNSILYQSGVSQKLVLGDKFGQIHLLDVSRKLILEKLAIP